MKTRLWSRRETLLAGAALGTLPVRAITAAGVMHARPIPVTDELLPVIGLGTYEVFDVGGTDAELAVRRDILDALIDAGGSVIDSSPMYNRAERVIGDLIGTGAPRNKLFLATKVWTDGRDAGVVQMRESARLMRTDVVDLMQVHNLRDTAAHMPAIREAQAAGRIRYSGLTHYARRAHRALEAEMRRFEPDFIQINYSLAEPEAADRLLPLAADLGIAVIVNRPFAAGRLFRVTGGRPVPAWAREFAASWGQFFLKFIVSHPAVTAAIPATSKPRHMIDNLGAGIGALPDEKTRQRMLRYIEDL